MVLRVKPTPPTFYIKRGVPEEQAAVASDAFFM